LLKRLRIKFVCITMAFATVMLCAILGLVIHFAQRGIEEQSIQMMRTVAPFRNPPERAPDAVRLPYFVVEIGMDGETVVVEDYGNLTQTIKIQELFRLAQAETAQTGVLRDYSLRFMKQPGPGERRIVFADISSEIAAVKNLVQSCVFVGIGGFFLFFAISVMLAKWAIRPVEQAWQQQKQFVADASHELKTPLTVIMTNAELLQGAGYSEAERRRFSDSIYTMSRQMRSLVEGLLELARVDNGGVKTGFSQVDISALVSEAVLPFEPLFFEKDLVLTAQVEPDIRLSGSTDHLHHVLDILLDNAMKYTSPGGAVQVSLKRLGRCCVLSVSNPGEPLSREELKDVFKRFYRTDKARSRDGSYGLGLSIAKRIVEEHRGRIWAESDQGMNRFFVLLPLNG